MVIVNNIIYNNGILFSSLFKMAMPLTQAVSCHPVTAEVRI
jgi:hypothetical protein